MAGKLFWTAQEDEQLRRLVATGLPHREIGRRIGGRSKQAVCMRLRLLRRGLSKRPWRPEEDALLRDTAGYRTCADLARELGRTALAVNTRASELGVCWQKATPAYRHAGFTANEVAALLGVSCAKAVTGWIEKGYLVASRRSPRLDPGPRLAYRVYPDALRDFLRDYPWLYDRARIRDRGWSAYVATLPREEYVGTCEAGRLLFMTTESVAQAIRRGYIRAEKIGANWAIPLSAIRAYVPPASTGKRCVPDEMAEQRAANLAARKSRTYTARPETVAAQVASRARRRAAA